MEVGCRRFAAKLRELRLKNSQELCRKSHVICYTKEIAVNAGAAPGSALELQFHEIERVILDVLALEELADGFVVVLLRE